MRKGQRIRNPQPCGTPAAYRRHHRHGENPCTRCKQAAALARAISRENTRR